MAIKPIKQVGVTVGTSSSSSAPTPAGFWPSVGLLANLGLTIFGAWLFSGHIGALLLATLAGAAVGWLHHAWRMKSKFGESFVSALFGAGWNRENGALIVLDVLSRALVGYFVGMAFGCFGALPGFSDGLFLLGSGAGGPGGAGGDGGTGWGALLLLVYVFLVVSGLLGALAMLLSEGSVRTLLYSAHFDLMNVAADAAGGASKSMVKEAARVVVEGGARQGVAWSALKGAVSGAVVGLVLLALRLG
jgi:hypothetical protein